MKWVKASERLPEDRRNEHGEPLQIFVEYKSFDETNTIRTAYTANQIIDFSKSPYYKELTWLDESTPSSSIEQDQDELKNFLDDVDFELAHLEDICHAEHGKRVTELRVKLSKIQKQIGNV